MARFLVGVAIGAILAGGAVFMILRHEHTDIKTCQQHVYGKWHMSGNLGQYPVQAHECRNCGFSELRPVLPPF